MIDRGPPVLVLAPCLTRVGCFAESAAVDEGGTGTSSSGSTGSVSMSSTVSSTESSSGGPTSDPDSSTSGSETGSTVGSGDETGSEASSTTSTDAPPSFDDFLVNDTTDPGPVQAASWVSLTAAVSDDNGVDRVEFIVDDVVVATDDVAPYAFLFKLNDPALNGSIVFEATAYDTIDQSATAGPIALSANLPPSGTPVWALEVEDAVDNFAQRVRVATSSQGHVVAVGSVDRSNVGQGFDIWARQLDAADGGELWAYENDGEGNDDFGYAVAVDEDDNALIGGTELHLGSGTDAWLARVDSTGVEDVTNTFPGPGASSDLLYAVAAAPDAVAWVGGARDDLGFIGPSVDLAAPAWEYVETSTSNVRDAAVHPDGDIFVAGRLDDGSGLDIWVARVASASGALLWSTTVDIDGNADQGEGVAVDADGNVYVGGFGNDNGTLTGVVHAFDEDGGELWSQSYGANGVRHVWDLAADPDGRVLVSGTLQVPGESFNIWVARLDPTDGGIAWERDFNGSDNDQDLGFGVATDALGYVAVGGFIRSGGLFAWVARLHP